MQLLHIDLGKLKDAAINMRHGKAAPDVSDILPSIKTRGVLVPLLVRPNGDGESFEVVAGRRRSKPPCSRISPGLIPTK